MKIEVNAEELEELAAQEKDPLEDDEYIYPKVSFLYRLRIWLAGLENNAEKKIAYNLKIGRFRNLKNR
jgi:hypothetical protein